MLTSHVPSPLQFIVLLQRYGGNRIYVYVILPLTIVLCLHLLLEFLANFSNER